MSTDLVVLDKGNLAVGGLGFGGRLFNKLKPATLEVVAKSTQQEGATPGRLRIRETGEQFDEMQLVLLTNPTEQRELYNSKTSFSADNKICFSLDNLQPHVRAREPQALQCKTCPKGDVNWATWRKNKIPENLPPCKKYWHLVVADRRTQMIYYFNVKGIGISPFELQMQNLFRLIMSMEANVKADNKKLIAEDPAAVLKPMPNIFDVTFTLTPTQLEKGGPWVPKFSKFVALKEEDREDFGNLYLDYINNRAQAKAEAEEPTEEVEAAAAVSEAPARAEVEAVVGTVVGEVVPKEQIMI
jgi:hypothetical protein